MAGIPFTATAVDGGAHGAATAGTHGAGVKTDLAAVAACTAGLARLVHMPKGDRFAPVATSVCTATAEAGDPAATGPGGTVSTDGVVPKEHRTAAPFTTNSDIRASQG